MTGESDEKEKDILENCLTSKNSEKPSPILISDCQITSGEGHFIVISVGSRSQKGKIMEKLTEQQEDTPLQQKLEVIASQIGMVGFIAALITFSVLVIRFFVEKSGTELNWADNYGKYLQTLFGYVITSIAIIVVAVPEGLPLAVLIALAYSVRQMLGDKNFVK